LKDVLVGESFKPSDGDPCLFVLKMDGVVFYVLVYVDDTLLACQSMGLLCSVKTPTAKAMSGRVHVARYNNAPTVSA
jgi:hypothetical protein